MIKKILNTIPRKYLHRIIGVVTPFTTLFFRGRSFECPVCRKSFRKMLSYGYVTSRPNAMCPSCLALERHRMMWYWLSHKTDFFQVNHSVLHIAPEAPFIRRFDNVITKNMGRYISADLESPLAKVKLDVQNIPFGDCEFDVVFCNHVLEHVPDDKLALREMHRVLKSGGWGILLSPVDMSRESTYEDSSVVSPQERLEKFGQSDHLRVYGQDYPQRLSECGFRVEQIKISDLLPAEEFKRMAFSNEILYIVHKH